MCRLPKTARMKFRWRKRLVENIKKTSDARRANTRTLNCLLIRYSYQRRASDTVAVAGIGDPGQRVKLGGAELIRVIVRQS